MEYTKKIEEIGAKRRGPEDAKLRNIVDMALSFSAMMRLFEEGSKETIHNQVTELLPALFAAKSEDEFNIIHTGFCQWGIREITRAEKKKDGEVIKEKGPASYGQMGKTLDVVLHVVIYYAHYPDCETSKILSKWLNAAMDTKMMAFLAGCYPDALCKWPKSIEQVWEKEYRAIQDHVRLFIQEEHKGGILPVQFDDVYWEVLNRGT